MSYSSIASKITNEVDELSDILVSMQSINYGGTWSGTSYDHLTTDLKDSYSNLESRINDVQTFTKALDLLQKYKNNKDSITIARASYNSTKDTEENASYRNKLASQISELEKSNRELKIEINSLLSSLTSYTNKYEKVTFNISDLDLGNIDLDYDLDELVSLYGGSNLRLMGTNDSLYKYYDQYDASGNLIVSGKDYVEGVIASVKNKYSGREAAVNSALAILKLASDKGIKLSYEHSGTNPYHPYVSTEYVATGVDCNPFVSWMVDKGTPGGFQWRPVDSFTSVGRKMSRDEWSNAQPGDVAVNDGHVTMIVENNPDDGYVVIAHASGTNNGIILSKSTYSYLQSANYQIRDMTNVYNGTENTNRDAFNQYVDWSTYQRKP